MTTDAHAPGVPMLDLAAITPDRLRRQAGVKWTTHPNEVIPAFVAEMDFGTAPEVIAALHRAVELGQFSYLATPLTDELAVACRDWHTQAYGWTPEAARIHTIPNVIRGLEVAVRFAPAGAPIILPTPAYMPFFTLPAELDREIIEVPMTQGPDGRHHFDLEGIERAFAAGGGLLVVCNPANPVGRVFERDELVALAETVEACGGRVFADEIHAPLVYGDRQHIPYASVSAAAAGHAITATSASKAWNLPGLQCASLLLTNEADVERWATVGFLMSHGASTLGVVANTAAYREGRPWLDAVRERLIANRELVVDLLAAELPGVVHCPPEGTYLAWLDCRPLGLGDAPGAFFLAEAGVALTEGALCGAPGFVRLNLATTPELLTEIIRRMGHAVGRRRHS